MSKEEQIDGIWVAILKLTERIEKLEKKIEAFSKDWSIGEDERE